ncbi:hypothetical protein LTR91_002671 [Friedmanniomyces endolithicus]|uniref:Fungal N-terminal domain-containing protein n=1 Tax=Friedmanniomyces endolithicus TaxID=329885 RepID=A0AAN6FQX7_9PEZI|nr:hypothetical protein LTR35_004536 [Friedmanniomyces endolithicus]KAK0299003.1 hypothetical protein LTS00_002113 [Friedmanniomyces endolithicus]KAK0322896.1 hypothetical protein LTR82_006353 [Friedmanniomyces endolithicus]KAK0906630.1 hypothetical protein LTR57_017721 [Friedmanniomyces endolithicus]KAK0967227.1 hypothetical protein LTS01_017391 [Friedmanniomyces endolithicus]
MATELQTIAAVFDLLKLAWSAGVFLKKVSDADSIALEALERIERLSDVLEGVRAVLQRRRGASLSLTGDGEGSVEAKIDVCIRACTQFLQNLELRLGGFNASNGRTKTLVTRFKLAWRHPSISKGQTDLEARISILQTNLVVLQLFDQAQTHTTIGANQAELLQTLNALGNQVEEGNKLLNTMLSKSRRASSHTTPAMELAGTVNQSEDDSAVSSLSDCLRTAEDIYERYTSEHDPDAQSIRLQDRMLAPSRPLSRLDIGTPESGPATPVSETARASPAPSIMPAESSSHIESHALPLRILNRYIADYRERARTEIEKSHFNQAETCLDSAARYSEAREQQYGVPFDDKVQIGEELASVYQQQARWAEAVSKLHELMRENSQGDDDIAILASARQNQLLASVYFDRHVHNASSGLYGGSDDLEVAEKHAHTAFARRDSFLEKSEAAPEDEKERHQLCMYLLVNILEARGKTVEANVWREMLQDGSSTTNSLRRASTLASRAPADFEVIEDRHEALMAAIRSGDSEQLQSVVAFQELNVEKVCGRGEGKTLLMHAVECSDESTVHRMLDPSVGANVDARNRKGRTALHLAAAQGRHEMVRCLLHHDADIEAKDNDGETPVVKAVQGGHREIVQDLLDKGANVFTKNLVRLDEFGLLHHAIYLQNTKMVNLLLDLSPDLRHTVDQAGRTALHLCAEAEKLDHAKALIEHKNHVDVNAVDSASRTPLYFAASKPATSQQREAMVNLLVLHGASADDAKPPLRMREYAALKPAVVPRRAGRMTRHDSISTDGSIGTVSSNGTKLSRIFSSRMGFR